MEDLSALRGKIDEIDEKLAALFEARMQVAAEVARYKQEHDLPVLQSGREAEVLEKNTARMENAALKPYAADFYRNLMAVSRAYQKSLQAKKAVIGFYGIEGSFSHEACVRFVDAHPDTAFTPRPYETFDALCKGLYNEEIDYAVIPLENSTTGPVTDVYDLLMQYRFYMAGEVLVRVSHNLMARPGAQLSDIREVYSHPQAFMQCKEYLKNFDFEKKPYFNTAVSAKFVAESGRTDVAAIASEGAAKLYGLKILEHNINQNANNITKIVILAREAQVSPECDKVSVVLSLPNKPGSLLAILNCFDGLNMTKIESRPDVRNPFDYIFFIDFEGNMEDRKVQAVAEHLQAAAKQYRYLGNYRGF